MPPPCHPFQWKSNSLALRGMRQGKVGELQKGDWERRARRREWRRLVNGGGAARRFRSSRCSTIRRPYHLDLVVAIDGPSGVNCAQLPIERNVKSAQLAPSAAGPVGCGPRRLRAPSAAGPVGCGVDPVGCPSRATPGVVPGVLVRVRRGTDTDETPADCSGAGVKSVLRAVSSVARGVSSVARGGSSVGRSYPSIAFLLHAAPVPRR
jgi:hypothetical protein